MKYISSNYTLNHDAYVGLDFFFFFRCTRTQTPKCRTADVWCQRGAWESRACGGLISISTIRSLFKRSRGRWRVKWAIHGFAGANHSTITRNAHTHIHAHTHTHTQFKGRSASSTVGHALLLPAHNILRYRRGFTFTAAHTNKHVYTHTHSNV